MVSSPDVRFPDQGGLTTSINRVTRKDENVYLDGIGLGETLFGDHMAANMIMLGAAYQAGALPVSAKAIEEAISLNGVAIQMNTQAFRAGRLAVADPAWLMSVRGRRLGAVETAPVLTAEARDLVTSVGATGELKRLLEIRVPELIAYQNSGYARSYAEYVKRVLDAERAKMPGETQLSEGVARYLFKLMAYKDEYEVARLHRRADVRTALAEEFPGGVRLAYNLHPPMLRALGWKNKIKFGPWFDGVFRALAGMRSLRGSALDPFGRAGVRRVERELPAEYRALVDKALVALGPATYDRAVKLANLPDVIRGYEDIKLRNVEKFRAEVRALGF
jgi:indolepyruvate ferredoxin oxidoreductase